jgi:hypothetical protein
MNPKSVLSAVLAFVLWLVTAGVGLWEILVIREMVWGIFARFRSDEIASGSDFWTALNVSQWVVLIAAIGWLALAVGTAEYHYRHYGERSSWRLFVWCIAAEVAILVLAYFV